MIADKSIKIGAWTIRKHYVDNIGPRFTLTVTGPDTWRSGALYPTPGSSLNLYPKAVAARIRKEFKELKRTRNPRQPAAAIIIGAKHQFKRGVKAAEKLANKIGHSVAVVLAPGGVRRSKRNTEGFKDASGNFHPIRSGDDYDPEDVGERRTYAPAKKKRKATKRKAARRTR